MATPLSEIFTDTSAPPTSYDRMLGALDILAPEIPTYQYPKDPHIFMTDVLGIDPWDMQREITHQVFFGDKRYTSVASCHGIGKTFITAAIALTFLHVYPNSIVLSTAPTGRQVEQVLWRSIRAQHRKSKRPLLGSKPLTLRYDIAEDWFGIGFKPTDTETDPIQGFHAEYVLAIIEEAAGVPKVLIDGLMAAMTTHGSRLLFIGNPTSTSGAFYESHHSRRDLFNRITIAWPDTPNFKQPGQTRWKGLITQQWVDDVIATYGVESPYYESRVMAQWVSAEGTLVSLAQIEAAQNRQQYEVVYPGRKQAGIDVARDGTDKSFITLRDGDWVVAQEQLPGREGWEVVGSAMKAIRDHLPECEIANIDVIGVGTSVYDIMARIAPETMPGLVVNGVNFAKTPHDPEAYANQRCEAYGELAQRFRTGQIGGEIIDECGAELSALQTKMDGRHTQPVLERKDDFRKRIGHSPDAADALALAFYDPPQDEVLPMGALAFGYAETRWGRI
jgi:phage terminase large subunit